MVVTTQPEGVGQRTIESALVSIMGRCFHRAGADVAAHILSDWQLGLWLGSRTQVFDLFPHAAHHQAFAIRCPEMPNDPAGFAAWWHAQPGCADLPPRIASACMACMEAGVAIPAQTQ
jgi:hypothetical protein